MEITKFKAGRYNKQYGYSSFSPEPVNHEWLVSDAKVNRLLNDATRKLGELNAFSMMVPDVDFFIRMHITKEATRSSRIEGTQTSMEEAILNAEYIRPEKRDDWQEVHNYIEAMNFAIAQLDVLPISTRFLKQTHEKLLQGVRDFGAFAGDTYFVNLFEGYPFMIEGCLYGQCRESRLVLQFGKALLLYPEYDLVVFHQNCRRI